jgi:hypothetical protein
VACAPGKVPWDRKTGNRPCATQPKANEHWHVVTLAIMIISMMKQNDNINTVVTCPLASRFSDEILFISEMI